MNPASSSGSGRGCAVDQAALAVHEAVEIAAGPRELLAELSREISSSSPPTRRARRRFRRACRSAVARDRGRAACPTCSRSWLPPPSSCTSAGTRRIGQVQVGRLVEPRRSAERDRVGLVPRRFMFRRDCDDAVEPGAEVASPFERGELRHDLDQDFLRGVLGVLRGIDHADDDVVDPGLMRGISVSSASRLPACTRDKRQVLRIRAGLLGERIDGGASRVCYTCQTRTRHGRDVTRGSLFLAMKKLAIFLFLSLCVSTVVSGQNLSPTPGDADPTRRTFRCPPRPPRRRRRADAAVSVRHATGAAARPEVRKRGCRRVHAEGHLLVFNRNPQIEMVEYDATGSNGPARVQPEHRDQSARAAHRPIRQHLGDRRVLERALEAEPEGRSADDARQARRKRRVDRRRLERDVQSAAGHRLRPDDNFYVVQGHGGTSPPEDCSFCTTYPYAARPDRHAVAAKPPVVQGSDPGS